MEQLSFTKEYFFNKDSNLDGYSNIIEKDGELYLKTLIFRQSSRIVYRSVLSFWDVRDLCKHTDVRPSVDEQVSLDIDNVKNRYLEKAHGTDIKKYIKDNIKDFIIPNLTTIINKPFDIAPNIGDENFISSEIFSEIEKNNGYLEGYIRLTDNKFYISDGNHRTFAIHELVNNNEVTGIIDGLYVGIDFYLETDIYKEKDIFVTLNTNKSIDPSVLGLLKNSDLLSNATKALLGIKENYQYEVKVLNSENKNYIGVDLVNDNVSKTNNTLSFNMIRNLISYIALDTDNTKRFNEVFKDKVDSIEYINLMKKISIYLNYILKNCAPFNMINSDRSNVKALREQYVSMTGAGLYVIAKVGHIAIENDEIDIEKLAYALCHQFDWRRETEQGVNSLFVGGILTSEGKIVNNRGALKSTTDNILSMFGLK